jgi:hypothetical protein
MQPAFTQVKARSSKLTPMKVNSSSFFDKQTGPSIHKVHPHAHGYSLLPSCAFQGGEMELPPHFLLIEVPGMNKENSDSNLMERNYSRELILSVVLALLLLVSLL